MAALSPHIRRTSVKPATAAQRLLRLEGNPYSLAHYPMFKGIFNTPCSRKLMKAGRQVSKTITMSADMLVDVSTTPHLPIIYANASHDQTASFSKSKLEPMITLSPAIYHHLVEAKGNTGNQHRASQVLLKQFRNSSEIKLSYFAESADRVRGLSARRFYLDEVQDILYDAVIDAEECLSAAKDPRFTYAGTSKTVTSTLEFLWTLSSKKEWIIKCEGCNVWNIPGAENIHPKGLSCKKCGKLLNTYHGHWHSFAEEKSTDCLIDGFHIPQIILPLHCHNEEKWKALRKKQETYPEHKFNNEILGIPSGEGSQAITEAMLQKICIPNLVMEASRSPRNSEGASFITAGIDWGGYGTGGTSRTALAIMAVYPARQEFRIIFGKVFTQGDPDSHVEEIAFYLNRFGCVQCVGDYGGGTFASSKLAKLVPGIRVIPAMYNDKTRPYNWNDSAQRADVNRTSMIDGMLLDMQSTSITAVRWEDFRQFKEDFLAVREEILNENSATPRRAWRRYPTKPDDFLHAVVFGWLSCRMLTGMVDFTHVAVSTASEPDSSDW